MLIFFVLLALLNYTEATNPSWTIPLEMYNDRVNLPFGIRTTATGTWTTKTGKLTDFSQDLNMTVNVNMPFSIFFNMDVPDVLKTDKVHINYF